MKYTVYYKETVIGILEINGEGKHKYTPDDDGIEAVKNETLLMHELLEKSDWRSPIPFFRTSIEDAKRFSQEKDIRSHTNHFRMRLCDGTPQQMEEER